MTSHRGALVPYGSTWTRLPRHLEVELEPCAQCCEWTDAQVEQMQDEASFAAEDYDPSEDREDVP